MTTIPTYCSVEDNIPEDWRDYEVYDRKAGLVLKDVVEVDTNCSKPWARVYILDSKGNLQFDKWGAALTEIKHGDFEIRLSDWAKERRDAEKKAGEVRLSYVSESDFGRFLKTPLPPGKFVPLSRSLAQGGSVTGRSSAKDANGNAPGAAAPAPVVNGGVTITINSKDLADDYKKGAFDLDAKIKEMVARKAKQLDRDLARFEDDGGPSGDRIVTVHPRALELLNDDERSHHDALMNHVAGEVVEQTAETILKAIFAQFPEYEFVRVDRRSSEPVAVLRRRDPQSLIGDSGAEFTWPGWIR